MANGFAPLIKVKEINAKLDEMTTNIQNKIDTWESDINNSLNNLEGNINDNLTQWKSDIEGRLNNDVYFNIAPSQGILYYDENEYEVESTDEVQILKFKAEMDCSLLISLVARRENSSYTGYIRIYKNGTMISELEPSSGLWEALTYIIELSKDDVVEIKGASTNASYPIHYTELKITPSKLNRIISIL